MQHVLLLIIIYLGFISLGLPDSVLGVAWPDMRAYFSKPIEAAGILVLITTLATAFSSFASGHIMKRLNIGTILTLSCFLTASALLGYAFSPYWFLILFFTLILGSGAGAIDSVLNHYVALNYSARHMNWLHACWGIGATLGPLIMTSVIALNYKWQTGYLTISIIQFVLAFLFLLTLKQWKKDEHQQNYHKSETTLVLNDRMSWFAILMFFFYTGVETSVGLWAFSLFVEYRGIAKEIAGLWLTMYWASLTLGRIITGIIAPVFNNRFFIRWGLFGAFVGVLMLISPVHSIISLLGLIIIGFSLAPIYPSMVHETPNRFGSEKSSVLIGYQVGAASIGVAVLPALIGWIGSITTMEVLPYILIVFLTVMITMNNLLDRASSQI